MRHVCKWRQAEYDCFDAHIVRPGDTVVCITGDHEDIYVAVSNDNWKSVCSDCDIGYPECIHYEFKCEGIWLRKTSNDMEEL